MSEKEAPCPECDATLSVAEDTMVSEIMQCTDCGSELEIMGINPLKLETAPEEEEDWGE